MVKNLQNSELVAKLLAPLVTAGLKDQQPRRAMPATFL